jgi:hypothetical protein
MVKKINFYRLLFYFVVITHHLAFWGFIASVPLLIIKEPPWVSLPLLAWIMYLGFSRILDCPYTRLENWIRRKIGLPEIKTFIKHYYLNWNKKL